ncbi:hypothetical protein FGO68_gene9090 [Halteria grandinella]|uniref:Uncharacterized protein n=1 Tax=Halteria grandinella TaxID=5974 RepID=A0A8J8NDD4_HALGN|nr:hypothetical protein FGO68_gene9090 [Halteria grandinella]
MLLMHLVGIPLTYRVFCQQSAIAMETTVYKCAMIDMRMNCVVVIAPSENLIPIIAQAFQNCVQLRFLDNPPVLLFREQTFQFFIHSLQMRSDIQEANLFISLLEGLVFKDVCIYSCHHFLAFGAFIEAFPISHAHAIIYQLLMRLEICLKQALTDWIVPGKQELFKPRHKTAFLLRLWLSEILPRLNNQSLRSLFAVDQAL